jgi:hypothetical protein
MLENLIKKNLKEKTLNKKAARASIRYHSEQLVSCKRSQVTIFIIIALIVIALALLVYFLWPEIIPFPNSRTENPSGFLSDCLEEDLKNTIQIVSSQGGTLNPENYILHQGEKVDYLCYTAEYYETCVMQRPLLKSHIESEIKADIQPVSENCLTELRQEFQRKGYEVFGGGEINVELLPNLVIVNFPGLTLNKEGSASYDNIRVVVNNNLYELLSISNTILNSEATYGDAETTRYMTWYSWLKVEKYKQTDGSTIYVLTDRDSNIEGEEDKFQFASRSVAWPPGYGV